MKYALLALKNLRRQPRRVILTIATMALASFIFTTLIAVPESMDRLIDEAAKTLRLIVIAPNAYRLPVKYRDEIKRLPHVTGCIAEIAWGGTYQDPREVIQAFGVDPDVGTVFGDKDYQLTPEDVRELTRNRRGALIGSVLMRKHGWHKGQQIILRGLDDRHMPLTFVIVAEIPNEHTPNAFVFRREQFDSAVQNTYGVDIKDRASFMVARVDRPENIPLVIDEIDRNFHNSEAETQTMTESDSMANNISSMGDLRPIVYGLCALVLLTMLLVAANSMAMTVRERLGEVAVMRALGFTPRHVVGLLLGEAALMGLSGSAAGAGTAFALFRHGITIGELIGGTGYMMVTPGTFLQAIGLVTALSVTSAIIPVLGALRVAPALAFRQVT